MQIQCDCGKFRAELTKFPKETPGRFLCFCDDCQSYLHYLKRTDLLQAGAGTEIVPVYPADIKIVQGKEHLKCVRLAPHGMFRFATTCCNTPIANTDPKRPWVGTHRRAFTAKDPQQLDRVFKSVRSSIMGKFARGTPEVKAPEKFDFTGMKAVLPFLLKGRLFGRMNPSPFFENGEAIVPVHVITKEEQALALAAAGHSV